MTILGITAARRTSARVPGKNTLLLEGSPIVNLTIDAAKNSRITHILAVSDDPLFLQQAASAGALTLEEPLEMAAMNSRVWRLFDWATSEFESRHVPVDIVVILQPNCPLRPPGLVDRMLDQLDEGFEVVTAVARAPLQYHPYFLGMADEKGKLHMPFSDELKLMLSGEFPPAYTVWGPGSWAFRREAMRDGRAWFEMNCGMVEVESVAIEIDNPEDLENLRRRLALNPAPER